MARMELEISNPKSENEFLQTIEFNFMELQVAIKQTLEKYKGITYTEDSIKTAKEDRAGLNKFNEALETKRKEVKKLCLKPYEAFDFKVKQLTAMVAKPIAEIDSQIKAFEEKKKEEKRAILLEFFDDGIGDLKELVAFERIFDNRWLNATFTTQNAFIEIDKAVHGIRKDLETIELLKSEYETELKTIYFRSLNLGEALKENEIRKQEKALVEEREKRIKEASQLQKQNSVQQQPLQSHAVKEVQAPQSAPQVNEDGETLWTVSFTVTGTKQQFQQLKEFFTTNKIEYRRI